MLKQAVYNKLGHLLYNDAFHQNIGDFNKLIHEDRDEEVYSQYSGTLVPNKSFKNFAPFKEKYDEQDSPSKSKSYSSPQLRSPIKDSKPHHSFNSAIEMSNTLNYSRASANNYRSAGTAGKNGASRYSSKLDDEDSSEHSNERNDTTKNISTHKYDDSSDVDHNEFYNGELGSERESQDFTRRGMLSTANPSRRLPQFPVAVESNGVIRARNELKEEIEKKGILQEAQKQLDQEIKDLKATIMELEKEKFKIKLRKDSIASIDSAADQRKRLDAETDSRGTQYLRTDLYGENNDDKVRANVEKSLKVENNANQWLKVQQRV
jgi:hypothetical protein